jgi:ABC-type uncharacterized transport system substrate-binding protein
MRFFLNYWRHLGSRGIRFCSSHVWVTMEGQLIYAPDGAATGVRFDWTFDDMFSAFATQGVDAKTKGQFSAKNWRPSATASVLARINSVTSWWGGQSREWPWTF